MNKVILSNEEEANEELMWQPTTLAADSTATTMSTRVATCCAVTGVKLSKSTLNLKVNGTHTLTATISPSNATNKAVTWTSSDTSVATVSASGLVCAKKGGTATVTVKTKDGGYTQTCKVTVTVPVTGVSISQASMSLAVNGTGTLKATVSPSNATNQKVTWSSSDTGVATVNSSSGLVCAKKAGTTTITVKTNDGGYTKTCKVTVIVPVTGVEVSKESLTMEVNDCYLLTACVKPSNATNKTVTWSSSDTGVATVNSSSGLVCAKKAGTTTITVKTKDRSKEASCKVTVKEKPVSVTGIEIANVPAEMTVNGSYLFAANVTPANATNKAVAWTSSNTHVATINSNSGLLCAKTAGETTITATALDGSNTQISYNITINKAVEVTGISFDCTQRVMSMDDVKRAISYDVFPENASDKSVTWTSSNPQIVAVDSNGIIDAISPGKAVITAKTNDKGYTATCNVEVIGFPFEVGNYYIRNKATGLYLTTVEKDDESLAVEQHAFTGAENQIWEVAQYENKGYYIAPVEHRNYKLIGGLEVRDEAILVENGVGVWGPFDEKDGTYKLSCSNSLYQNVLSSTSSCVGSNVVSAVHDDLDNRRWDFALAYKIWPYDLKNVPGWVSDEESYFEYLATYSIALRHNILIEISSDEISDLVEKITLYRLELEKELNEDAILGIVQSAAEKLFEEIVNKVDDTGILLWLIGNVLLPNLSEDPLTEIQRIEDAFILSKKEIGDSKLLVGLLQNDVKHELKIINSDANVYYYDAIEKETYLVLLAALVEVLINRKDPKCGETTVYKIPFKYTYFNEPEANA